MVHKYITDKMFNKLGLVYDIKSGKLSKDELVNIFAEIDKLTSNNVIDNPIIQNENLEYQKQKKDWNEDHLNRLIAQISCLEIFSKEHCSYLLDVSNYLNHKNLKIIKKFLYTVISLILVILSVYLITKKKDKQDVYTSIDAENSTLDLNINKKDAQNI